MVMMIAAWMTVALMAMVMDVCVLAYPFLRSHTMKGALDSSLLKCLLGRLSPLLNELQHIVTPATVVQRVYLNKSDEKNK